MSGCHETQWAMCLMGKGMRTLGGKSGEKYILAFRVIAMGDLNAVDLSQQVHLEILKDCKCMDPGEVLEFRAPVPASHTFEGLYIDDHIVTQILPSKKNRSKKDRFRDEDIVDQSRAQYEKLGIPTSSKKAFEKCSKFVAWGTEVDSKSGRVGTPQSKLRHLADILSATCKLKLVSKKLLQGVTGLLVHPFLHRRIAMSVLQDTFAWINKLKDGESRPLPLSVKEELLCCGLILPFAHTNVKWGVSCRIGASDASLSHGGRAAASVTKPIAQTLYRYAEHKGEHIRLDWEKGSIQPVSQMQRAPPELENLISDLPWNTTESCSFAHRQHINILEAKMIKHELCDIVMSSSKPLRCVLLVDSRAAAGAWGKGRSSSRQLNRVIRQSLGWSIAGRKSLHLVWVRSECNPADFPSRKKRIPEPRIEPSEISKAAFGDQLEFFRTRRSNRDMWRQVNRDSLVPVVSSTLCNSRPEQTRDKTKGPATSGAVASATVMQPPHPAASAWTFREIFAGTAHLTKVFHDRSCFKVGKPLELMHQGRADSNSDILNDEVFARLCSEAQKPRQYWHFGFPCGSFSMLQNLNKGTRSNDNPSGNGTIKREILGNRILHRTLELWRILHNHGSFFTLENPLTSYAWKVPAMISLIKDCQCQVVRFDQCQYGLKMPASESKMGLALKPTTMVGTLPHMHLLSRRCSKSHEHVAVIGGVRHNGKWRKRSELAGSYPRQLCQSIARLFERSFA